MTGRASPLRGVTSETAAEGAETALGQFSYRVRPPRRQRFGPFPDAQRGGIKRRPEHSPARNQVFPFALAGANGAVARVELSWFVQARLGTTFAWATVAVNRVRVLALGVVRGPAEARDLRSLPRRETANLTVVQVVTSVSWAARWRSNGSWSPSTIP